MSGLINYLSSFHANYFSFYWKKEGFRDVMIPAPVSFSRDKAFFEIGKISYTYYLSVSLSVYLSVCMAICSFIFLFRHLSVVVESMPFDRRVVGSNPALATMYGRWASPSLVVASGASACKLRHSVDCCGWERF